jgi:hypothetical protein
MMALFAGLMVGILIGALSWWGLAAGLEVQRRWGNQAGLSGDRAGAMSFEPVHEQTSRG